LELVESKLHPPLARPGTVARTVLVDRLLAASAVPVVCMVAPAGYGKTTLLAQWVQAKRSRVGWVSVDQRDNDPAVLLTYVAVALDRLEAIDPRVMGGLAGPCASMVGAVARLAGAVAAMTQPVALVLDHLELLENQQCLDVVAELAVQLPHPGSTPASTNPGDVLVGSLMGTGAAVAVRYTSHALTRRRARRQRPSGSAFGSESSSRHSTPLSAT
jgi:LuxR family maltose regulon positive regulatory protein